MIERLGLGAYAAGEAHSIALGRGYKPAVKRPVIFFTGGPGDARDHLTTPASGSHITPVLTRVGFAVIGAAFGGGSLWGNDVSQTRIGQVWTQVKAEVAPKTDKFIGIGVSKGYTALDNYARANPANVAALVGIVPVVDLTDIRDNNRAGAQASIDAAYGGNYAAQKATHDPALNAGSRPAIPTLLLYGTDDQTVLAAKVQAFAAAASLTARSLGAFDHTTTAPRVSAVEDVLAFIDAYA